MARRPFVPNLPPRPAIYVCPKCNVGSHPIVTWHRGGSYAECGIRPAESSKDEHLHYHCRDCGYDWIGPTKDAE